MKEIKEKDTKGNEQEIKEAWESEDSERWRNNKKGKRYPDKITFPTPCLSHL